MFLDELEKLKCAHNELTSRAKELEDKIKDVCEYILDGMETPTAFLSTWWRVTVEFKLKEAIALAEKSSLFKWKNYTITTPYRRSEE